jgi:hypothetical protein
MSSKQCSNANWEVFGEEDGAVANNKLEYYLKQCTKYFTAEKQREYKDGYFKGMATYCSFERGKKLGSENEPIPTNCPDTYAAKFREGYNEGLEIFCSYERGKSIGLENKPMPNVCPAAYAERFREGFAAGQDMHYANYCSFDNGHRFGLSGKEMPKDCPSKYITFFTQGFNAGNRERTLTLQLNEWKVTIDGLNNELKKQRDHYESRIKDMEKTIDRLQRQVASAKK